MSARGLLSMTEVSPLWKEIVEKEGKLGKKICLKMRFEELKDEDLAALHESHRQYEDIDIIYTKQNKLSCIQILQKFSASVVDLAVREAFSFEEEEFPASEFPAIDFPNLKRLKLDIQSASWLTNSTLQLEEVIVKSPSTESINKLLEGQKKLKILDISSPYFAFNFVPEFALEVFRLESDPSDNFSQFLHSQRQSLKEVELEELDDANCFIQLMNEFPLLTKLCIEQPSFVLTEQQASSILINTKITYLEMGNVPNLSKLPNLKHLKVSNLNSELMELIVLNMPQLEKLIHQKLNRDDYDVLEKYEQLKRDDGDINRNIEIEVEEGDYYDDYYDDYQDDSFDDCYDPFNDSDYDPRYYTRRGVYDRERYEMYGTESDDSYRS